jgi:hypothetical protein
VTDPTGDPESSPIEVRGRFWGHFRGVLGVAVWTEIDPKSDSRGTPKATTEVRGSLSGHFRHSFSEGRGVDRPGVGRPEADIGGFGSQLFGDDPGPPRGEPR